MNLWRESGQNFSELSKFILPIGFVAVLSTILCVGWYTQPDRFARGYQPQQPIPFSHKLHAGTMRMPCLYCHSGALKSRQASVPSVEKCMNCHKVTKTDSPYIKKIAAVYASERRWNGGESTHCRITFILITGLT